MAREQLQNLTEPMYYVLLALLQPRHGYEIMQRVATLTDDRVKIGAGTLYGLLSRFHDDEIVQLVSDDGRRKTYHISELGRGLLQKEYLRLQDASRVYTSCMAEAYRERSKNDDKP
ncbi:MAG: PadR family transcriptional regulator [Symbiobacteriaceae bacterium]|nr:PadR family transcriptional regulator [Symbiobacteriaceae bacterium]